MKRTILIAALLTLLTVVTTFAQRSPTQQAKTTLASLTKAMNETALAATVRELYFQWYDKAPTKPGLEVALFAGAGIATSSGPVYPSTRGKLIYATDTTLNEPAFRNGVWRFVPGRKLVTSEPLTAVDRTLWVVIRKMGDTPLQPDQGHHRILDHGRDMALMATKEGVFVVSSPSTANDANCNCNAGTAFDFNYFKTLPRYSADWQTIILRYKPGSVCLSVNGKEECQPVAGSKLPRTEPLRIGQYENGYGAINAEVKAFGMIPRFITETEVQELIKTTKN